MRILHCLRAPVGGLFRHVLDLAGEQAARGHDVGIIADKLSADALTEEKFSAVENGLSLGIHRIAMPRQPGLGDWRAARDVARLVAPININVLHGHGAKGGAYARLAARRLNARAAAPKIASVYTPHGGTLHFSPTSIEGRIYFSLERFLARTTDAVIFESAYSARLFRDRVTDRTGTMRIVPNGLRDSDFEPVPIRDDATDVLFVGELRHLKGVDILLQALSDVGQSHPVTATIVGGGPDAEAFKSQSARLGLGDRVNFTGPLPARDAFTRGRIMVVPSRAESFPYIVLEAGAAGRPLIATHVGGIPEIVADTTTDLIQANDVAALSAAIQSAIADPSSSQQKAETLKARIADRFTVKDMTDQVLDIYRAISR